MTVGRAHVGRPPGTVRWVAAVTMVQALVIGGVTALALLFTVAFYTQRNPPNGATLDDNIVVVVIEAAVVIVALALGIAGQRLRRGSEPARRTAIAGESLVALGGLALGVELLGFGVATGVVVWLVVPAPAVLAVVALTGAASRNWCR